MEILDYQHLQKYLPKAVHNLRVPWQPLILVPIGDTQFGSDACSVDRFKKWLKRIQNIAEERGCQLLFIGMGDYTDGLRPSIRKAYQQAIKLNEDEHVVKSLLREIQHQEDGFLKMVNGTEGKWIGMLEGHHFFDYGNGVTSDTRIAERLGAYFLGDCARVHITFERPRPNGKPSAIDFQIWCHHGEGGGYTPGSPLNKLMPLKGAFEADAFLMGHQHKSATTKVPWCYDIRTKNGYKMVHKDISLTCTGGWLQGYQQGSISGGRAGGSYPEQKLLVPLSIGGTRMELVPVRDGSGDWIYHEVTI